MAARIEKSNVIELIKEVSLGKEYLFVLNYTGVDMCDMTSFRNSLYKKANCRMFIAKNTLSKIAINGSSFSNVGEYLSGQNALIFCEDPTEVAKLIQEFCMKKEKFALVACSNSECVKTDISYVKALASMPTLDVARAQLLSTMNSACTSLVRLLTEPSTSCCRVFNAYCG